MRNILKCEEGNRFHACKFRCHTNLYVLDESTDTIRMSYCGQVIPKKTCGA